MSDNETVSKGRVPTTVGILSVPMLLDSIFLWITAVPMWFTCCVSDNIVDAVTRYTFLTLIPWIIVHHVFVIGGVIVKLVNEKKWFGNIGLWLCLMSILHVIVRAFPFALVFVAYVGKSV